jgi:hydrogenase/urease accessory protein HupE
VNRRAVALACAALLVAANLAAHELGTTQVSATFHDGAYRIDVAVDPDALLTKLEVFGSRPLSGAVDRAERDRRIAALAEVFLDRTRIAFDGIADRPRFEYLAASRLSDMAQAPSLVRLTGTMPRGVETASLSYGLAMGSYALNVHIDDSPVQTFWLDGAETSPPIPLAAAPPASRLATARQYLGLGFTHILPKGLDHILFVVGIFLLSARWRDVLLQVSTFTIAHSITLGLTIYGIVSLPARVVEPMIAVSIAYVAIENLVTAELKPWRLALVFSFGLLHGMGFAGVLRDLGLPRAQFLTALAAFNVGVEAGQLAVIAMAYAVVAHWRRIRPAYRRLVVQPVSIAIALIGAYWTVQRALFW